MHNFDKLMLSFGFVIAGVVALNFINLVYFSNPTKSNRSISPAALVEGMKFLNAAARRPCAVAIREHLQHEPGDPSDTVSDGRTMAVLTWQRDASRAPGTIVCHYEEGLGVTKLTMDDRVFYATSAR